MQLADVTLDIGGAAQSGGIPGASDFNSNNTASSFSPFLSNLLTAIMAIAALLVLVNLLWGAIEWITSGGDSAKTQKARDKITQSVIGIIVLSATIAIFQVVQSFLGVEILRFGL